MHNLLSNLMIIYYLFLIFVPKSKTLILWERKIRDW